MLREKPAWSGANTLRIAFKELPVAELREERLGLVTTPEGVQIHLNPDNIAVVTDDPQMGHGVEPGRSPVQPNAPALQGLAASGHFLIRAARVSGGFAEAGLFGWRRPPR